MDFNINKKGDANTFSISYLLHIVELYVTRKTTQKSLKKRQKVRGALQSDNRITCPETRVSIGKYSRETKYRHPYYISPIEMGLI